eukprot:gb/GECG01014592.1/.p1 GENE.gb/GECG01014592.1/~~gb/GECG01014592.1/.p1  ORF type:complete len:994 (+),score=180.45 gb/GECG01014592.1/:1-2982(+)
MYASTNSRSSSRGPPPPSGGVGSPYHYVGELEEQRQISSIDHQQQQPPMSESYSQSMAASAGMNTENGPIQQMPVTSRAEDEQGQHEDNEHNRSTTLSESSGGGGGYFNTSQDSTGSNNNNFKVVIRVRPPLQREMQEDFVNCVKSDEHRNQITISEGADNSGYAGASHTFTFDKVYGTTDDQKKVYETTAQGVVSSSLQGYNATIFAYGQTGTGKTYTMEGFNSQEERGIIPRAIEQIFQHIRSSVSPRMRFLVRASYLQIYNEVISDLLKPERTNLSIREDKKKGVFVEGLSEWVVRSPAEIYGLMERGGTVRATGSTKMNHMSSRSHAVFIIIAEQSETTYVDDQGRELSSEEFQALVKSRPQGDAMRQLETNVRQCFKVGKLNLVDLAGSERVRLTGATGQRLEESKKINQSLSALGNVIAALTDTRGRQHIPYRDSKLTRILEDSLGGNCKTTMMAMISPALEAFVESLSTLKFANRAKNIKNEARVNEDLDQKSLLRRYERELKRLRTELDQRSRTVVDKRRLLELDEQRRRAEQDKMAAIQALERRSEEFMKEKEDKRQLEERINLLQGQVLVGGTEGKNVQDTPAFRNALKEHQEKIRREYESRLHELERERETIEEEKAQVDRYKQLLLKQRDIMILLTQRLNERDDQIVALQDELDAYDRHQRELEEKLDEKTASLIHLQRVTMEQSVSSPDKNAEISAALGDWASSSSPNTQNASAPTESRVSHHGTSTTQTTTSAKEAFRTREGYQNVSSSHLVETKQFKPYQAPTVFTGDDDNNEGATGSPNLLSAEEKINELQNLVESGKNERERLARELEEVQAEKVSMEYLLREKLEKLVQSEIEARLAAYKHDEASNIMKMNGDSGEAAKAAAEADVEGAKAEVEKMQAQLSAKDAALEQTENELQSVKGKLETHEKERKAIQTIVEHKISSLVNEISKLTNSLSSTTDSGSSSTAGRRQSELARQVRALHRLVNATTSALQQSNV